MPEELTSPSPVTPVYSAGSIPSTPPRVTQIDLRTMVLRADPGLKTRPVPEYEFSNGRVFYDRPVGNGEVV